VLFPKLGIAFTLGGGLLGAIILAFIGAVILAALALVDIDIEVNLLDAGLGSAIAAIFMPPAIFTCSTCESSRHFQLPPGDKP
jgi:integral membrane sensor domain MASE1